ncbi:hypothetical protein CVIRNUC_005853 [Coccomyxa viridis]|uniref:mannosyl-glycoprotein endo-beta-N-acetylglucosaminidase n=1 Tax=Coccomyxa viridis TaxID=1274662 RepID=A0AAV1I5N8_9CHLO|nr:hypothetical protein CVIRNUC_005853 [Coccomyxa viridis]
MQVSPRSPDAPKLLVCHDMAGGYHEDAWAQGCDCIDPFYISHWHLIDTFVYFSHSLVTIPPPGWIDSAHLHSVQVLGTLITEWDEGRAKCEAILESGATAQQAARQLAAIAAYFGFDGWLINIENQLDTALMPRLLIFIRTLREAMRGVCSRSQVIWYDAVTTKGHLKWQNTLNALNMPFFEASDALFVNYAWKAETPGAAAAGAGERRTNVYMGIDVFGRGTYGGGQLNTHVAAAAASREGLSVALFAPAWVYEGEGNARSAWRQLDQEFWDSLAAVLPAPKPAVNKLPFASDFNTGFGAALYAQVADVDLPGGVCLEAVMRQRGQGRVTIGLLDASDASMALTEAASHSDEVQWTSSSQQTLHPGRLKQIRLTCSSTGDSAACIDSQIGIIRLAQSGTSSSELHVTGLQCSEIEWRASVTAGCPEGSDAPDLSDGASLLQSTKDSRPATTSRKLQLPPEAAANSASSSSSNQAQAQQTLSCTLTWAEGSSASMHHVFYCCDSARVSMTVKAH